MRAQGVHAAHHCLLHPGDGHEIGAVQRLAAGDPVVIGQADEAVAAGAKIEVLRNRYGAYAFAVTYALESPPSYGITWS